MDGLGDLGGMMDMMRQAQEHAKRMQEEAARRLAEQVVEGTAGGGMVKVSMTAGFDVKSLDIDPEVIDKNEKEMLEDLVIAALNQALKKAHEAQGQVQQNQMGDLQKGLGGMPGMGGLDLSKLFGG